MRTLLALVAFVFLAAPVQGADRPRLRLSFSVPGGQVATFNAFDPATLENRRLGDVRNGSLVTSTTVTSHAHVALQPGRSWGARLRVQTWDPRSKHATPLALEFSWSKEKRSIVQVWARDFSTVGTYYERCPYFEGPCVDYGSTWTDEIQYNEHEVNLHVLRAGLSYDLAYRLTHFSLEPGLGMQWSLAQHSRKVFHRRYLGSYENYFELEDSDSMAWNSNQQTTYAALSADIYPFGKRRFFAVGASTRYLVWPGNWAIHSGTMLADYDIPIRNRRWSTTFHATLGF